MYDPAAPNERPPYWGRCEEMSFVELRKFIDYALKALSDPNSDVELPRSKEGFVDLADMLSSKLDAMKAGAPDIPPRPSAPPGYAYYMSPWFEPSEKLESAKDKLERLLDRLDEARYDPSSGGSYIDHMQRQIRDLQREVELRETGEREEYEKRYASYRKAAEAHERNVRRWRVEAEKAQKIHRSLTTRSSFVERIRRDINRAFKSGASVSMKHVYWRLLPPGRLSRDELRRYYAGLQSRNPRTKYVWERIEKALELGPNQRYEEIGGVEGYIVFTFPYTSSVLLECPKVGNAIYVIHSDWERWSKMSKQELMADTSGEVTRIPHQGDWFQRVKQELGTPDVVTGKSTGPV